MTNTNPLQVSVFDHLTIIVSDLAATKHFYVNVLGMTERPRPDFDFTGAWYEVGNMQIHATVASELAGQAGWGERGVKRNSRGHHFAFRISDVDAALKIVKERGIAIADGPKIRPDGAKQLYIFDPDQHVVELFSI